MIWLVAVLFLFFAPAVAQAQGPDVQVPVQVTAEQFLQMSTERQFLYFYGVLDTLTALATDKLIPKKAAACARINYKELLSEVKSDLHKALGSETSAVREA